MFLGSLSHHNKDLEWLALKPPRRVTALKSWIDRVIAFRSWMAHGPARSVVCFTWGLHSGPRTFFCSIFTGFSLPCLVATAILDSFPLFYLPNRFFCRGLWVMSISWHQSPLTSKEPLGTCVIEEISWLQKWELCHLAGPSLLSQFFCYSFLEVSSIGNESPIASL